MADLVREIGGTVLARCSEYYVRHGVVVVLALTLAGCFELAPSRGGGEASFTPPRAVRPADVALPAGYQIGS
jgi:hypothetical protein